MDDFDREMNRVTEKAEKTTDFLKNLSVWTLAIGSIVKLSALSFFVWATLRLLHHIGATS